MKLSTRIGAALALLLVVISALAAWQLLIIGQLHDANRQLAGVDLEISRTSLGIRREIDRLSDLTQRFFVLRDTAYRAELQRVRGLVDGDIDHLSELPVTAEAADAVEELRRRWGRYSDRAEEVEELTPEAEPESVTRRQIIDLLDDLRRQVEAMDAAAVARSAAGITESTQHAMTARRISLLVGAIGLLLVALLAVWISGSTIRPLRRLAEGVRAITEGDFEHRVTLQGPLEVRSLAEDFNDMAQRLGEVDEMKSEFLSTVSHDLKAPLASMQETNRLLLEDNTASHRSLLELHSQSADRLQRMIDDLLDVARLESGTVAFEVENLDLISHCRQVLDEAAGLLQSGRIEVATDWPERPVFVRADSRYLMRALWNLVSNAAKFSPEGSRVSVTIRRPEIDQLLQVAPEEPPPGPCAVLSIADQGAGVADQDKAHIFDRFYRSRRHERYASGTGLGLAITRSIVDRLGGHIWVEDVPGGGSVFRVLLPAIEPERNHSDGDAA